MICAHNIVTSWHINNNEYINKNECTKNEMEVTCGLTSLGVKKVTQLFP